MHQNSPSSHHFMAFHYNIFLKKIDAIYKSLDDFECLLDQLS
ncbi:hypothetical protein BSBH6_00775 [Bacillus subtilis]|nr:hypothetical protein BSBH6_00775 [Bacillus subtilis]RPK27138.1 hypothetical protein BH5_00773 [Bacillus subtilis]